MRRHARAALVLAAVVTAALGVAADAATREHAVSVRAVEQTMLPTLPTRRGLVPTTTAPALSPTTTTTPTTIALSAAAAARFNPREYDVVGATGSPHNISVLDGPIVLPPLVTVVARRPKD